MTFVTLGQEFFKIVARDGEFRSKAEALTGSPLLPPLLPAQGGKPSAIVLEAPRIEDFETYPASRTCELTYGNAEEQ